MALQLKTDPYPWQAEEYYERRDLTARALLWQPRTGKTKPIIDTLAYHWAGLNLNGAIIVAPNGVHSNWTKREFPRHCPVPYKTYAWRSAHTQNRKEREIERLLTLDDKFPVLAINSETIHSPSVLKVIHKFGKHCRGDIALIVDECHDFRSPGSSRTKRMRALSKRFWFKRILSGTPVENSPLAAFTQFELLQPQALGFRRSKDFKEFFAIIDEDDRRWVETDEGYIRRNNCYDRIKGYQNLEILQERLAQWSSVVTREQAGLALLEPSTRGFGMSRAYREIYNEVKKSHQLPTDDDDTPPLEGSHIVTKLQQISRGFFYGRKKEVHRIDGPNLALQALGDEIEQAPNLKRIIWCRYAPEIDDVCGFLRSQGRRYVEYHGRVKPRMRDEAIDRIQNDPRTTEFVGQAQAGGAGLTLDGADEVVWYSHLWGNTITRQQASERATNRDKRAVSVVDIVCDDSPDVLMLDDHADKESLADYVSRRGLQAVLAEI